MAGRDRCGRRRTAAFRHWGRRTEGSAASPPLRTFPPGGPAALPAPALPNAHMRPAAELSIPAGPYWQAQPALHP